MAGDFSRRSVNRTAGYSGVLMQQGRVQLDADWNEQLALAQHRTHVETRDVIGCCGTLEGKNGFLIEPTPAGDDFFIHVGRYYVGGLLCEIDPEWVKLTFSETAGKKHPTLPSSWLDGRPLQHGDWVEITSTAKSGSLRARIRGISGDRHVHLSVSAAAYENLPDVRLRRIPTYLTQPFYPRPDPGPGTGSPPTSPVSSPERGEGLDLEDGEYLVYLEAWQREVNALEDPHLREVALGGPDTSERLQTVWQVKLLRVSEATGSPPASKTPCQGGQPNDLPEWDSLLAAARTTGQLNARSAPPIPDANPCILPPSAGYQGLENQLYRVEIFQAGATRADATYVWSRDDAMVETAIVGVDLSNTNVITVTSLGTDDLHSFGVGDWVEVVDRDGKLQGAPRFLAQIVAPAPDPSTRAITLGAPVPNPDAIDNPGTNVFRLRRWDMTGSTVTPAGIPVGAGWLALESGVQVSFSEGRYAARSFWLIPARTATADIEWPPFQIPNSEPIPQPPVGEHHELCRLAQVSVVYGTSTFSDIRVQFASLATLTNLYANLRFHKKYLHGAGVVCGLEVRCAGGDGTSVVVRDGYAIDCEGNDILVCSSETFDVISAITTPSGVADGDYSLYIDTGDNNQLKIEPYTGPANLLANALKHTVWEDFHEQYLKPLQPIWDKYSTQPADAIVKDRQRVFSSLTNLLYQYVKPAEGSEIYVSGVEHNLLASLYKEVEAVLTDKTFCGLVSGMRPVPSYPAAIDGIDTGFGEGFKTRLRMDVPGSRAAATGNDNTIHLYQIENRVPVLTQVLTLPGAETFTVVDARFAQDGNTLHAIANDGTDSTFAMISLQDTSPPASWSSLSLPGVLLKSLAVMESGRVVALASTGLYSFTVSNGQPASFAHDLSFNSTGQLAEDGATLLFAAASSNQSTTDQFNEVIAIRTGAAEGAAVTGRYRLPSNLQGLPGDDIAVVPPVDNAPLRLYVTAGPAGSKTLLVSYLNSNQKSTGAWLKASLENNDGVRFAYDAQMQKMMMSFATTNQFAIIEESAGTSVNQANAPRLAWSEAFPAEVMPASFVGNGRAEAMFALNAISNTITVIPYGLAPWASNKLPVLREYRIRMIEAWTDLLAALLQYLKDGFCDLLVLKCRVCDAERNAAMYLAGVTVKNGRVHKVCNFSKRQYVQTFPGVEYWLSVIPVLPMLELGIKELCCFAITDYFATVAVPKATDTPAIAFTPTPSGFFTATTQLNQLNNFTLSAFKTAVLGQVGAALASASTHIAKFFAVPTAAAPASPAGVTGTPQQGVAETDIAALKAQFATLQASYTKELATRDRQITQLTKTAGQLQNALTKLTKRVGKISPRSARGSSTTG